MSEYKAINLNDDSSTLKSLCPGVSLMAIELKAWFQLTFTTKKTTRIKTKLSLSSHPLAPIALLHPKSVVTVVKTSWMETRFKGGGCVCVSVRGRGGGEGYTRDFEMLRHISEENGTTQQLYIKWGIKYTFSDRFSNFLSGNVLISCQYVLWL